MRAFNHARACGFLLSGIALLAVAAPGLAASSPYGRKSVLLICGERSDLPSVREIVEVVRQTFHNSSDPQIELFPEYLDFARFPTEQHSGEVVHYLRERYADRKIDLILAMTGLGLEFAVSKRNELFPGVPIVFCATDQRALADAQLPADVTGIPTRLDFDGTVRLIFALQPNPTELICVAGTSVFDQRLTEEARQAVARFAAHVPVRWITDKSLQETKEILARASPKAAVFFISMLRDASGHFMSASDAARDFCQVSAAPVYGVTLHFVELGTVGGSVFDFRPNGQRTAELAIRVLRGEWVPPDAPELRVTNSLVVSWPALKKWQLPADRIPGNAEVRNKPATLWETNRKLIIGTAAVVALQALLIVGLIAQRFRRRLAESSLRESEERFQHVADAAPVFIWMADVTKACSFVNQSWCDFTGRSVEQEKRDGWHAGIHPEDVEKCGQDYVTAFDARKPFVMQYRLRRHDGEYRWITDNGVPRYDARGTFLGYVGACVDITELLDKERTLRDFEQRAALAAEAAHLGVWEMNTETNAMWLSEGARDLFQFEPGCPVTYELFQSRIHPEDRARRDAAVSHAIATCGSCEMEYRAALPDKTVKWIGARVRCIPNEEKKCMLIGVSMDVTRRKQAEELFQLATEASPSGVLLLDGDGRIILVNARFEELFGYHREELLGQAVENLFPTAAGKRRVANFFALQETEPIAGGRELRARRKDGTHFPAEVRLNPIQAPQGLIVLVGVMDLSGRKLAEEEARKHRDEVNRLSRIALLGEMTASIAHEVNQPLAGIMSNAGAGLRFLEQGNLEPDEIREILADIASDARRAHDVIKNIRETIKKGTALRQDVDLNDVVRNTSQIVRPEARAHSCEMALSLTDDLPGVEADPVQIQQVLINLLGNAFDAMRVIPIEHRRVEISTQRDGDHGICLSVRDHGIGLPDGCQERLFEQFFTTKESGLGMGLTIVRSIIEAHAGRMSAENVEDGGARFSFVLPAKSNGGNRKRTAV